MRKNSEKREELHINASKCTAPTYLPVTLFILLSLISFSLSAYQTESIDRKQPTGAAVLARFLYGSSLSVRLSLSLSLI
jgi:hypothetical protein